MSADIRSILERMAAIEGKLTPTVVKHGLNRQQQSVPQLPALLKPHKISVLTAPSDPQHPLKKYAVGSNESQQTHKSALEEAMQDIEEDMLSKVKQDLTQYLDKLEQKINRDRALITKAKDAIEQNQTEQEVEENDYELSDPSTVHDIEDQIDTRLGQPQQPVKVMELDNGVVFEVHGNDADGYQIQHRGRSLPSRFKTADEAGIAMDLFRAHHRKQNLNQDYIEEK
jgi:hypothetical protein